MTWLVVSRRLLRLLVLMAVAVVTLPPTARADVTVVAICTTSAGSSPCTTSWYTTDVTLSFQLSGQFSDPEDCGNVTISSDTAGYPYRCTVLPTGSQVPTGIAGTIKRDATPPTVNSIALARGPDANGWYNHAVAATVTGSDVTSGIASCSAANYSGPDSSSASLQGTCTDNAGNVSAPVSVSFKYDATAPSVTPSPSRSPDANGWYNHQVDVAFKGSDSTSGIAGCTSASYSGPDNGSASVSGSCTDQAGNTGTASFALEYDATPPTVTGATADRPPDANGFYTHTVTITFAGSDATSGIASCDVIPYDKPDSASSKVTGVCHDNAGNTSVPSSFAFKYDSTPPKLDALVADEASGQISLTWKASADVARIVVTRRAGSGKPTTVYSGKRISGYTDRTVRAGARYSYVVVAEDAAGNEATASTTTRQLTLLYSPRQDARVRGSVMLRWRPVPHATYYNVQLWLGGVKLLSSWPSAAKLRVPTAWTYLGRSYRLRPGRYTWYVWPGRGSKSRHRFGPLLGSSSFRVVG